MAQQIGQITNADVYINETDLKGRIAEFDPGELGSTEIEHATLGMIGVLKLPGRPVQAIEGSVQFEWLDETIDRSMLNPTIMHKMQLHSYVDVFGPEGLDLDQSHTLVTHLGFQVMKRGGITAKLGEGMGGEYTLSISTFMQKVYGQQTPIIEYDGWNGIYDVNGVPVWPR